MSGEKSSECSVNNAEKDLFNTDTLARLRQVSVGYNTGRGILFNQQVLIGKQIDIDILWPAFPLWILKPSFI